MMLIGAAGGLGIRQWGEGRIWLLVGQNGV